MISLDVENQTRLKTVEVERSEWLSGQRLAFVRVSLGHFLALIGDRFEAPRVPTGELPKTKVKDAGLPLPSDVVRERAFDLDEWVYDPTVCGRVVAADEGDLAVRCADHLITGQGKALLVGTDRRQAVVVEKDDSDGVSTMGRVFGVFTRDEAERAAGSTLLTWWEVDNRQVRGVESVVRGRLVGNLREFTAITFADGSVLEVYQTPVDGVVRNPMR